MEPHRQIWITGGDRQGGPLLGTDVAELDDLGVEAKAGLFEGGYVGDYRGHTDPRSDIERVGFLLPEHAATW